MLKQGLIMSGMVLIAGLASADPADVGGVWLTEAQDGIVRIDDCGDGTPCGTLVWFDETNAASDRDINIPDPELRDRPVKGMVMLSGFERSGDRWRRGRIYNAENGRTYRSAVSVRDDGNLKLQGCVGPICQTQTWTPLPEDDPRVTGD